ncbi:MAG: hypothetical protein J6O09_01690 [Lachnospiraceae bacterium]|nr:hypothetical protein [Lachnospiraceae bacterium]
MIKGLRKIKIAVVLIVTICMNQISYAGYFVDAFGFNHYYNDSDGKPIVGWRWMDSNGDGLAECYRFNIDGTLVTNTIVKGKEVNDKGQWVVDGEVQRKNINTGKIYRERATVVKVATDNEYMDLGTRSTVRRINATGKDIEISTMSGIIKFDGPEGKFVRSSDSILYGKGTKKIIEKRPVATSSSWGIIADAMKEEEIIYLTSTESIIAGRDMRRHKTASNKYTEKADNVKIYGGGVWNDVMVLQGNGAYVKFSTSDTKAKKSKYKANYFRAEVAHQTHGESTSDTYCGLEVYLNGKSVEIFDQFCDGEPETIEMWLDEGESTVEFRAVVTGDAPGRKIYIRNARFRQTSESEDD